MSLCLSVSVSVGLFVCLCLCLCLPLSLSLSLDHYFDAYCPMRKSMWHDTSCDIRYNIQCGKPTHGNHVLL